MVFGFKKALRLPLGERAAAIKMFKGIIQFIEIKSAKYVQ
jgi:hypothetical protein